MIHDVVVPWLVVIGIGIFSVGLIPFLLWFSDTFGPKDTRPREHCGQPTRYYCGIEIDCFTCTVCGTEWWMN